MIFFHKFCPVFYNQNLQLIGEIQPNLFGKIYPPIHTGLLSPTYGGRKKKVDELDDRRQTLCHAKIGGTKALVSPPGEKMRVLPVPPGFAPMPRVSTTGSWKPLSQKSWVDFALVLQHSFYFIFSFASSEKALIKKKNIRPEKRSLKNTYWLTSKYKLQSLNLLCRLKIIPVSLLQNVLKSTVPRYFLETVPSTGTAVLLFCTIPISIGHYDYTGTELQKTNLISHHHHRYLDLLGAARKQLHAASFLRLN